MKPRVSSALAMLVMFAAAAMLAPASIGHLPSQWSSDLAGRLLIIWSLAGFFVLACLAFGQWLVRQLSRVPRDGSTALAFSSGALVFAVSIGFFGWAGLLGRQFFWLLPTLMLALGWSALMAAGRDAIASWRGSPPFTRLELVAVLFGAVCLGLLLLQVLSPENINYDASWYHLRAAQRYALAGAIERTPEGDMLLALPSATSWLYTWAFLAPGLSLEDQVSLALHLELAVFIGTLACLPALIRALLREIDPMVGRLGWVALFFFPSVFIYDTGLMGGADHMVALWAAASVLAWAQARDRRDPAAWLLLGVQLAGLSAKYSSLYLLVPFVPLMVLDAWFKERSRPAWDKLSGLFIALGVTALLTAPYWLRNWWWYGNPLYPSLSAVFHNRPWTEDAEAWQTYYRFSNVFTAASASPSARLVGTLRSLFDYHLSTSYGWSDMMGGSSVMGSGYFVSMLLVPLVPARRRLALLAVVVNCGIMVWFNVHQHHMRYLTVLTPLMAAGLAATVISLWPLGWPARAGVVIVGLVLLAGSIDVPFRHTHRMWRHSSPIDNSLDYLGRHGVTDRFSAWKQVSAALPPVARPLLHGVMPPLGLARASVTDGAGFQFGINYGRCGSAAEAWRRLRMMGVTHLIWGDQVEQPDSVAGEAIFAALAAATVDQKFIMGIHVGELPAEAPSEPGDRIVHIGCSHGWPNGVFSLSTLAQPLPPTEWPWPPLTPITRLEIANWTAGLLDPRVGWVALDEACALPNPPGFTIMERQQETNLRYFVRAAVR